MSFGSVKLVHNDGTMHHLGINESVVAKKVILTPDPLEIPFYAGLLDDCKKVGEYREYVTYTGSYQGTAISIMSCGFGCMPMAIAVEELNHLHAEKVIKIEACATAAEDVPCKSVCLCKGAVRCEGASREYIDDSYPAVPNMALLAALNKTCGKTARLSVFRSHDCLNHDSPYVEGGMERAKAWTELGVEAVDGGTSAMYVVSSILGVKTVSAAVISENYATGEALSKAEREESLKELFLNAAEALVCC